jgi:hypothetical protein
MSRLEQLKNLFEGEPFKIGDIVRLVEDEYETDDRPFFYGHEFRIKSIDGRIFRLIDIDGNELNVLDKHLELIGE